MPGRIVFSAGSEFAHSLQDFRFPSFPRKRESSNLLKKLYTRLRGHDEFKGLAKVLALLAAFTH